MRITNMTLKNAFAWALAGVFLIASNLGTWRLSMDTYLKQGVQDYHHLCFFKGPMILLDEETGAVIQCAPLGMAPPEPPPELQKKKKLDNGV